MMYQIMIVAPKQSPALDGLAILLVDDLRRSLGKVVTALLISGALDDRELSFVVVVPEPVHQCRGEYVAVRVLVVRGRREVAVGHRRDEELPGDGGSALVTSATADVGREVGAGRGVAVRVGERCEGQADLGPAEAHDVQRALHRDGVRLAEEHVEERQQLVVDLLVRMGYGGSRREAGEAIGQSGDEGIDGIIKEDRLGLDIIYVQAKRWEAVVGRPEVQKFAVVTLPKPHRPVANSRCGKRSHRSEQQKLQPLPTPVPEPA